MNVPEISAEEAIDRIGNETQGVGNNLVVSKYKTAEYSCHAGTVRQDMLNGSQPSNFTELFGEADFSYQSGYSMPTDVEYHMYVWFHEFEGTHFVIYSGEGYGSTYEVVYGDDFDRFLKDARVGKTIVKFLKDLAGKLQEKQ